jgi:hypothetical protein
MRAATAYIASCLFSFPPPCIKDQRSSSHRAATRRVEISHQKQKVESFQSLVYAGKDSTDAYI